MLCVSGRRGELLSEVRARWFAAAGRLGHQRRRHRRDERDQKVRREEGLVGRTLPGERERVAHYLHTSSEEKIRSSTAVSQQGLSEAEKLAVKRRVRKESITAGDSVWTVSCRRQHFEH